MKRGECLILSGQKWRVGYIRWWIEVSLSCWHQLCVILKVRAKIEYINDLKLMPGYLDQP